MPTAAPTNPTEEDIKAIARFLIQTSYDDGVGDLTIERSGDGFTGQFVDRTDAKKIFEYEIAKSDDGWEIGYGPISGVGDDEDEDEAQFGECWVAPIWNPAPFEFEEVDYVEEEEEDEEAKELEIEFAELDNPDLYFLKALLETHYTDGITNIRDVELDADDNIVGIFEDKVSPRLTKYFRFRIADDGIDSDMLNPNAVANFAEDNLEFKAATKGKNCVKGRACGNACIPAARTCKTDVPEPAKKQVVVVKAKLKKKGVAPKPGTVTDVAIADLNLDPTRFQYKLVHGSTGSSGSLTGVRKWDPNLAGIVQVWRDPADGKDYIVNGHNRANLAKGLGVDKITVRYLDVKDAAEARAVGALTNIAEGRGTALDAAKFFKDSGLSKADLDTKGIPMREKIATDGLALSSLDDSLFRKVIDGDIATERATIVGGSGLDHKQQRSLVDLIDKQEKRKRKITNDTIKELADGVKASTQKSEVQFDLFGGSQVVVDNAVERASLQASMKQRLSRDKKLFGTVSKSKAAADLQKAGNVIDIATSQKISQDAATTLAIFDQLKNVSGPVSKALNDAADHIMAGDSTKKVQDDLYKQIVADLPKLVGSSKTQSKPSDTATQTALFGEPILAS